MILTDGDGTSWNQVFFIRTRKRLSTNWWTEEFADTPEKAEAAAKKYVHLGEVMIEEQLTRTVRILEKEPVCL